MNIFGSKLKQKKAQGHAPQVCKVGCMNVNGRQGPTREKIMDETQEASQNWSWLLNTRPGRIVMWILDAV